MKKFITLFSLLVVLANFTMLNAQLTFDFEAWTAGTNFETPNPVEFWADPNVTAEGLILQGLPASSVTAQCQKSSTAKNGFLAAELTAVEYDMGGYTPNLQGWLHTGSISLDPTTYAVIADIRVESTEKWENFSGWYKYTPAEGDSCTFYAELYTVHIQNPEP